MQNAQDKYDCARRFQFSLWRMLVVTAVLAVVMFASIWYYLNRVVGPRPRLFLQAIRHRDYVETDRLLDIDPDLVNADRYSKDAVYTPPQTAIRHSYTKPRGTEPKNYKPETVDDEDVQ